MPHGITVTDRDKIYPQPLEQLKLVLAALGDRAFAGADAEARRHGWQVYTIHFGFGRRYRDPRFDTPAACPGCHGRGVDGYGDLCLGCSGADWADEPADGPHSHAPLGRLP
jgi:hypothetical protein